MKRIVLISLLNVFAFLSSAQEEVTVFYHAGAGVENDAIREVLNNFNEAQDAYEAVITELPGAGYNEQVTAAALSGNLPCLLDFDGPYQYNYAWAGYLRPIDAFVDDELLENILPTVVEQGMYDGQLYSLSQFEGGLGIWGNRSLLEEAGVRIPEGTEDAWTLEEFSEALEKLSELDGVVPLDLKMNYGAGEWFTYGFSPIVQSFGGDLIDRGDMQSAEGVLNGPEAVEAMTWFQDLFAQGYSTATPPNDNLFVEGEAALSYVGHWEYTRYLEALGDDLVLIPVVDFGQGPTTGMGSWAWAITESCENPEGAWAVLEFLLQPEQVQILTDANGAIPSRIEAIEADPRFAEGGPLRVYYDQLMAGWAEPRPQTPAYPVITEAFAKAASEIAAGADVQESLDEAVDVIDQNIATNDGYQ